MIKNDDDLKHVAEKAGELLQEIQDYLGRSSNKAGRVRFPRQFIRPAQHYRDRMKLVVPDHDLRQNLSYNFMLSEIYLWILIRTDLSSVAADIVAKAGIVLAGSICECLMKQALKGVLGAKKTYKERTRYLADHSYISDELQDELDWLWDRRKGIHIDKVQSSEYDHYKREFYGRAATCVRALLDSLNARAVAMAAA